MTQVERISYGKLLFGVVPDDDNPFHGQDFEHLPGLLFRESGPVAEVGQLAVGGSMVPDEGAKVFPEAVTLGDGEILRKQGQLRRFPVDVVVGLACFRVHFPAEREELLNSEHLGRTKEDAVDVRSPLNGKRCNQVAWC